MNPAIECVEQAHVEDISTCFTHCSYILWLKCEMTMLAPVLPSPLDSSNPNGETTERSGVPNSSRFWVSGCPASPITTSHSQLAYRIGNDPLPF